MKIVNESLEDWLRHSKNKLTKKINEEYQQDLQPYTYNSWEGKPINKNILSIGWLEKGIDFSKGEVPLDFLSNLSKMERINRTKGWHDCPFCGKAKGSDEIEVKYNKKIYRAPSLITHYIQAHQYKPPEEFIEAVTNTADKIKDTSGEKRSKQSLLRIQQIRRDQVLRKKRNARRNLK